MQEQVIFQARVDKQLRDDAVKVLDQLGLELPTAFRMFLRSIVREQGLPLSMKVNQNSTNSKQADVSSNYTKVAELANSLLFYTPPAVEADEIYLIPRDEIFGSIPTRMFVQLICKVPEGKITRWVDIEAFLCKAYKTNAISRGSGLWPWYTEDKERIPYWRVLTTRGVLYDQTGCSRDQQREALVKEGFTVIESGPNGRSLKVDHYRDYIYDFSDLKIVTKEKTAE